MARRHLGRRSRGGRTRPRRRRRPYALAELGDAIRRFAESYVSDGEPVWQILGGPVTRRRPPAGDVEGAAQADDRAAPRQPRAVDLGYSPTARTRVARSRCAGTAPSAGGPPGRAESATAARSWRTRHRPDEGRCTCTSTRPPRPPSRCGSRSAAGPTGRCACRWRPTPDGSTWRTCADGLSRPWLDTSGATRRRVGARCVQPRGSEGAAEGGQAADRCLRRPPRPTTASASWVRTVSWSASACGARPGHRAMLEPLGVRRGVGEVLQDGVHHVRRRA